MAFVRATTKKALPPGTVTQFRQGETEVAVCNVDGEIYAVTNICPHQGGPLAMGALHSNLIVCPWHGWEFDCVTGKCERNPRIILQKFPVKVEGEDVLVEIE